MGLEIETVATQRGQQHSGKLYLDSKTLTFKSRSLRWTVALGETVDATAVGDRLEVRHGGQLIQFATGKASEKWAEKINHPPDRVTKLGVKPGHRLWLSPGFSKAFANELRSTGASITRKVDVCDIAFWSIQHREELAEFPALANQLADGSQLWIVWPKGSAEVTRAEVIDTARANQFGPSKTAAFDDERSSMRFANKK